MNPYNKFIIDNLKYSYPDLVWKKDMKLNNYTLDELKIIHASIKGKVRNGSKKDILSFINDYQNPKVNPFAEMMKNKRI